MKISFRFTLYVKSWRTPAHMLIQIYTAIPELQQSLPKIGDIFYKQNILDIQVIDCRYFHVLLRQFLLKKRMGILIFEQNMAVFLGGLYFVVLHIRKKKIGTSEVTAWYSGYSANISSFIIVLNCYSQSNNRKPFLIDIIA